MRIISVANQKGGCGKTTTAINLAAALHADGQRTLLLDLDPQAHASLGLNLENQDSIYNVISKLTPRKLQIHDIIKTVAPGFDIVPSNVLVGTLEQELSDEIGREIKLAEILNKIKGNYDYVVIDCPPSLGFLTINAIRACDEVYMPVETSRFSMQGVEHLLDIVSLIKDRLNHPVECRILITMFDSRLRHSFAMLAKLRERFSTMLFDTIIHVNVKLKESAVLGKTVINYDKYCRGSKDYFSLAKEVVAQKAADQPATGPRAQPSFSEKMQTMVKEGMEGIVMTRFTLKAPGARSVYVTGSFNDWSLDESCRMHAENGEWTASLCLTPGVHKYQFIVDGRWQQDPNNPRQERNSFGDINSLVEVGTNGAAK